MWIERLIFQKIANAKRDASCFWKWKQGRTRIGEPYGGIETQKTRKMRDVQDLYICTFGVCKLHEIKTDGYLHDCERKQVMFVKHLQIAENSNH